MEKKLIALGPKTRKSFNVTLPIDWVRKHALDKSRIIDVEVVRNAVVIRPPSQSFLPFVVNISETKTSWNRIIQILYREGVNSVKIVNSNPKLNNQISELIEQRCIGFEIVDQGQDYCIIKDVAKESSEDFQALLRRSFLIVVQLAEQPENETLNNLDKSLNKITAYCQRLLVKQGYAEFQNINNYVNLCKELERLGDEFKRASMEKRHLSKHVTSLVKPVHDVFYKFTPKYYDSVQDMLSKAKGEHYFEKGIIRRLNSVLGIVYALKNQSESFF